MVRWGRPDGYHTRMDKPCIEGVVAVIERDGCLLAIRRAAGVLAGGCWCLPGGAIEAGESPAEAVAREVREEVGLEVQPVKEVWQWLRPDGQLRLYWWLVRLPEDAPPPTPAVSEVAEVRWVRREEFHQLEPILESNLQFMEFYCRFCRNGKQTHTRTETN
jgi:8-oxo-dGTP diphosphatase